MCGIFGSFNFDRQPTPNNIIEAMSNSVVHRGPDFVGYFSNDLTVLGNRRLSILDLSDASNQPIYSKNKKIVLVQNGEIFNYLELKDELRKLGASFASTGDTEVLLRAYQQWGPGFVSRLNGMFAIAIYDAEQEKLFLYRDRLGVKPCYISGGPEDGTLWFGSEIKTILANGKTYGANYDGLAQFFALNYIPQPTTAFEGIEHLPPGHMAEISVLGGVQISQYWNLLDISAVSDMTEAEAKSGLLQILDDATRIRMRADAPFGAFLSGGLDSSSVVGFMSLYQTKGVRTFSIGFDDERFDETSYARMAAKRFGTIHEARVMRPDVAQMWPRMIWHCDQPHGDVSFMPTDQVASIAAKDVKMVLTGDGGDELFAGYEKYLDLFPAGKYDHLTDGWENDFARSSGLVTDDQPAKLFKGALKEAFFSNDPYRKLVQPINEAGHQDPINRVLLADTLTLLPGNNLVKPDRMAMANSLEVRSPFLDYRMAEFAFTVPGSLKLKNGETKWIYKQAVEPLLGAELTYRKKQMFTVPVGEWFRGALFDYCKDILLDGRLEARNILDCQMVESMINDHADGRANFTRQLRAMISVEIWFRLFVDRDEYWVGEATKKPETSL